jgi:hypothetical protein
MQGDTAKARTAYQDFLTLWKDADPDRHLPVACRPHDPCGLLLPFLVVAQATARRV